MTGETKKIGIYNAYKATYTKEVEEDVFSFSRRQRDNQKQMKQNNPHTTQNQNCCYDSLVYT